MDCCNNCKYNIDTCYEIVGGCEQGEKWQPQEPDNADVLKDIANTLGLIYNEICIIRRERL